MGNEGPGSPQSPQPGPSGLQAVNEDDDDDVDMPPLVRGDDDDDVVVLPQQAEDANPGGLEDDPRVEPVERRQYDLDFHKTRALKKNIAREDIYKVRLNGVFEGARIGDVKDQIKRMFQDLIERSKRGLSPDDFGRIYLNQRNLFQPIIVPPTRLAELDAEKMMRAIESVLQSEENISFDDSMEIHIGTIRVLRVGRGKSLRVYGQESLRCKKSVVRVRNTKDNMCMARALVICTAKKDANPEYAKIRVTVSRIQRELAVQLHRQAQVPTERPCTFQDLASFERVLGRQVVVFSALQNNKPIYIGKKQQGGGVLFLYHSFENEDHRTSGDLGHLDAIISIKGFLGYGHYCEHCLKGYNQENQHRCFMQCNVCLRKCLYAPDEEKVECQNCNRVCRSQACFDRHKTPTSKRALSSCDKFWKCDKCFQTIYRTRRDGHTCGSWNCKGCKKKVTGEHSCYMSAKIRDVPTLRHIYFDFECTQEDGTHIPNFVVIQTVCDKCKKHPLEEGCVTCGFRCMACDKVDKGNRKFAKPPCTGGSCGKRDFVFEGPSTCKDFCVWLFKDANRNATVIAHNAKGYDLYFILDYMINEVSHAQVIPQIIYTGSKIMYMNVKTFNIRFIDSLNFFPMRLASLPKAFDLKEITKGYFPHYFNKASNWEYKGPYPPTEDYGANFMMDSEREAFLRWHEQQDGKVFDFRQELEAYCRSDVDILRRSCLKFRDMFLEITEGKNQGGDTVGLDPFDFITIASVCMSVFRSMFLQEEHMVVTMEEHLRTWEDNQKPAYTPAICQGGLYTDKYGDPLEVYRSVSFQSSPIAIVSPKGYAQFGNYSQASIHWLKWFDFKLREEGQHVTLQHALTWQGEKTLRVKGKVFRVDGYYETPHEKVVLEFNGCYFHGCPDCFTTYEKRTEGRDPVTRQSIFDRYRMWELRQEELEAAGYTVKVMWEHAFEKEKKENPRLKAFVDALDVQERLIPREAFFGGRTNASTLHATAELPRRILYKDMTSMYPTVNKFYSYPKGHADVITCDFKPIESYFGIAKVKVLPPRGLFHPVLPVRGHGKLLFPLCRTCAEQLSQEEQCTCTDEERAIVGTWVTLELKKAVEKGYRILTIYEVYHFPERCEYDPAKKTNNLFTSYVNTFLKYKMEASGWPEHCKDQQSKWAYRDHIYEKEGIYLNWKNIEVNKGLRSLSKLMLNSFWGKFGQRDNFTQTTITRSPQEFYKTFFDGNKEISNFHILNEDTAQIDWNYTNEALGTSSSTNIFIAAFTTAHARLMLYDVLDKLGKQVLYYDTDSVIYSHEPGQYDHPVGEGLGEFTDELVCSEVGCPGCDLGHSIVEFWSAGPKNYAYRVDNGHQVCKVRGFTLNHANASKINLASFKDIIQSFVDGDPQHIVVSNPQKITRDKLNQRLFNRAENKRYGMVYNKRRIDKETWITYPYGY